MTYKFRGTVPAAAPAADVQWGIVGEDGAIGYGSGSSPTGWTGYRSPNGSNSNDHTDIGYGKDGSGDGLWVRTTSNNNLELAYASDITATGSWTSVNVTGRRYNVKWANDKWIAVGSMSQDDILTSTDGATWSSVDVSGLTDLSETDVHSLATDGGNNWIFGQDDRVYASTNHGVNWFLLKDFDDSSNIREAAYSNNKWYVMRTGINGGSSVEKVGVASSASSGSWTDSADILIGNNAKAMFASISTGSASESTVIVVNSDDMARSTDSGATFTRTQNCLPFGSANGISSDGSGNWVVVHNGGDVSYSNDDGQTWNTGVENLSFVFPGFTSTEAIKSVAPNKVLPL
tara:strand:+ start:2256 stop:3293 length:1038 start_codon:yes stop_codon:yes gene_type:complete